MDKAVQDHNENMQENIKLILREYFDYKDVIQDLILGLEAYVEIDRTTSNEKKSQKSKSASDESFHGSVSERLNLLDTNFAAPMITAWQKLARLHNARKSLEQEYSSQVKPAIKEGIEEPLRLIENEMKSAKLGNINDKELAKKFGRNKKSGASNKGKKNPSYDKQETKDVVESMIKFLKNKSACETAMNKYISCLRDYHLQCYEELRNIEDKKWEFEDQNHSSTNENQKKFEISAQEQTTPSDQLQEGSLQPGTLLHVYKDFTAVYTDELTCKRGNIIIFIDEVDENWVECYDMNRFGIIPRSHIGPCNSSNYNGLEV